MEALSTDTPIFTTPRLNCHTNFVLIHSRKYMLLRTVADSRWEGIMVLVLMKTQISSPQAIDTVSMGLRAQYITCHIGVEHEKSL